MSHSVGPRRTRPNATVALRLLLALVLAGPLALVSPPAPAGAGLPPSCAGGGLALTGMGTDVAPYLIADRQDLECLRDAVNGGFNQGGVHFRQTADIDLAGVTSWVPIGIGKGSSTQFRGHYDGDLHRITGLTIKETDPQADLEYFGLFGYVRNGSIERLRLTGVDIDLRFTGAEESRYAGGLAGYVNSSSSPATTRVATVSVQGVVRVAYAGDRSVYVGGIVGRGDSRAELDDRLSFIGDVGGSYASRSVSSGASVPGSAEGNFGGMVGRMSSSSSLSLGYAWANLDVAVRNLPDGTQNFGDVLVGVLTGSSSSRTSELEELYAVGSVRVSGPRGQGTVSTGVVGLIEDDEDSFTDIFHLDTLPFSGGQVDGFDVNGTLDNVRALSDAQLRGANAELNMTGTGGRWAFANGIVDLDPSGPWYLVLEPAGYPVFEWEIGLPNPITDLAQSWRPTVLASAPASTGPVLTCTPTDPPVGATVTCTVTGGDPDVDIWWQAEGDGGVIVAGAVTLAADGTGTFSFVVPRAALGQTLTVQLVEWTDPLLLGTVGGPVPGGVPAGEGLRSVDRAPVALTLMLSALLLAGIAGRRVRDRPAFDGSAPSA